jgi:alpha-amylase
VAVRFILALHNHQPVGNFGHVFANAYRDSYAPFLELLDQYPEVPFALHTSGPLLEWLVQHRPDYLARLKRMVARGQVEIIGGGFYEPILTMIPPRDRIGQISSYKAYLEDLFQTPVRGLWLAERVWEQNLVSDLAAAGVEYTILDDHHFRQAGVDDGQLFGHYLSEDNGNLVRIFPISEAARYMVPFQEPGNTLHYLGEVAGRNPNAIVVCADDGEKFGVWPETFRHCYQNGWLCRFLDTLRDNRHWIQLTTFAQALAETASVAKVYLPDSSYREMTEWALPVERQHEYHRLNGEMQHDHRFGLVRRFQRAGTWRNFKVRYPETAEMYARMIQVSQRIYDAYKVDRQTLELARRELYQAQCNCPWWHGSFGGLYLPHLRNAVYQHLIAAENALLRATLRLPGWVDTEVDDLDLDGTPEVCLSNSRLAAYFHPARGGSLYELDLRPIRHNLLATLARRPEVYHDAIRRHEGQHKQAGLEQMLRYDWYPRKSFIDHFYEPNVSLQQLAFNEEHELGDFVLGAYQHELGRQGPTVRLTLWRMGQVAGQEVKLTKEVSLAGDSDRLEVRYLLENLPRDVRWRFAVECNFAGLAAGADDRYFYHDVKARAGQLQTWQDVAGRRLGLVDEWLGLDAGLTLSRPGGLWAFPIQTVSQSESGYELVHQSTAVFSHWLVEADAQGRWEVTLGLNLDMIKAEAGLLRAA